MPRKLAQTVYTSTNNHHTVKASGVYKPEAISVAGNIDKYIFEVALGADIIAPTGKAGGNDGSAAVHFIQAVVQIAKPFP